MIRGGEDDRSSGQRLHNFYIKHILMSHDITRDTWSTWLECALIKVDRLQYAICVHACTCIALMYYMNRESILSLIAIIKCPPHHHQVLHWKLLYSYNIAYYLRAFLAIEPENI